MALAAPLPTGAVTFAFTDIEGSTARWERDREAMQEAGTPSRCDSTYSDRRARRPRVQDTWFVLAELPRGSNSFTDITVNAYVRAPGQIQWDGQYLAFGEFSSQTLYGLSISGTTANVVSTVKLRGVEHLSGRFLIDGTKIVTATGRYGNRLGFWQYPDGGQRQNAVGPFYDTHHLLTGITVSVGH